MGLYLGSGCRNNTFNELAFKATDDFNFDNRFIYLDTDTSFNTFSNISFPDNFYMNMYGKGSAPISNKIYGIGGKVQDYGFDNHFSNSCIKNIVPTILKRDYIFSVSGTQLTNFPMPSCTFTKIDEGIEIEVPSGTNSLYLDIPFKVPSNFKGNKISLMLKYQCPEYMNGLELGSYICGSGKKITDYTANKQNYMAFYADYDAANSKVVISFSGNRTASAKIQIHDIVVMEGASIPYVYNYQKNYVDN